MLADLARQTTVLVIEDVHWADEATLDLLKYLGRRLHSLPSMLILTYRDDALAHEHPLRGLLGDLGTTTVHRIELTGLSEAAVRTLAQGTAVDPALLHRRTNGNPFFVTEALAGECALPATVRDAVLARAVQSRHQSPVLDEGEITQEPDRHLATHLPPPLDACIRSRQRSHILSRPRGLSSLSGPALHSDVEPVYSSLRCGPCTSAIKRATDADVAWRLCDDPDPILPR